MAWDQDVFSSMAQAIGYDDEAGGMIVTWANGKRTIYLGVPEDVARDTANAASVGEYINSEIKGRYSYRNI